MTRIFDGPALLEALKEFVDKADKVRLAVAFWGAGAVEALGLKTHHDVEVLCNLKMGGTNPDEVERLLALGVRVLPHETLHAKMGIVGALGFVGSSNISANGLGIEGREAVHWDELNVVFDDSPTIDRLNSEYERMRDKAEAPLKQGDPRLQAARLAWEQRRFGLSRTQQYPGTATTLLSAMKEMPEWFRDRRAYLVLYKKLDPEYIDEYRQNRAVIKREYGTPFDCYWGWEDLPTNSQLLDFQIGPKGGAHMQGIYIRDASIEEFKNGEYQVCIVAKEICGFRAPTGSELSQWKALIQTYWLSKPVDERENEFIDLYQIATNWLDAERH